MTPTFRTILVLILTVIVGGWLAYRAADRWYLAPRAVHADAIRTSSRNIERYRDAERDHAKVRGNLQRFVDRTLGGDFNTVDGRMRSRLNRLAEQAHLDPLSFSCGTDSPRTLESPARNEFRAWRDLRNEKDFVELEGWANGVGTLEQALTFVESIRAEPWLNRIERLTLTPRDNGSRVEVRVRLTTLYLPARLPNETARIASAEPDLGRAVALAQLNPFRLPPAPPPAAAPHAAKASPSQSWQLTGIARSAGGEEVWLLNTQTRESRRMTVGETFHQLTLVAISQDGAEFKSGEDRFLVAVGKNLGDRTPLHQ